MHHLERGTLSLSLARSLAHSCSLLTHTHTHTYTHSHILTHTHTHTYTIHNSLWLYFSAALCYSLILTTTGSIKKLYTCECVRVCVSVCVCVCVSPPATHTHTHTHTTTFVPYGLRRHRKDGADPLLLLLHLLSSSHPSSPLFSFSFTSWWLSVVDFLHLPSQ